MSKKMIPCTYIGTSGWNYEHWKNIFYPTTYTKSRWLQFYAQNFSTVEVNTTFYRIPKAETFENCRRAMPEGFLWAVKANRYITHIKRLRDTGEALERFFSAARLKEMLGSD